MDTTAANRRAFAAAGYTVVVLVAGSNLPTPLYPTYQRIFALSPMAVTFVYAVYAVTVMPLAGVRPAVGRRWPPVSTVARPAR